MDKILTKRKREWVKRRSPDVLRGLVVNPNAAVASRYHESLRSLISEMVEETEKQIRKLFEADHAEAYFAEDATVSAQARIITNYLLKKFNARFAKKAKPYAERFANQARNAASSAAYHSVRALSGGLSLPTSAITDDMKQIMAATITENVSLIKSISQQYLSRVQQDVMRSITHGNGLKDLIPALQKSGEISYARARMIAMDQNRKVTNNLSSATFQNLGLTSYEWIHTGGSSEPRQLHIDMGGNIYRFDDPPIIDEKTKERGIPGQAINCRCRMVPVIKFDD